VNNPFDNFRFDLFFMERSVAASYFALQVFEYTKHGAPSAQMLDRFKKDADSVGEEYSKRMRRYAGQKDD
jgi:hypothetical protein